MGEPPTFTNPLGLGYTITIERVRRWGMTWDEYHDMLAKQRSCCAICDRHQSEVGPLVVDHDHSKPGKVVRGLLCQGCNLGLGHFRDDPILLGAAARYLYERGFWATTPLSAEEAKSLAPFVVTPDEQARRQADAGPTYRLDLRFRDGRRDSAAHRIDMKPDGTFEAFDTCWRISGSTVIPPSTEGGRSMERLLCDEVTD